MPGNVVIVATSCQPAAKQLGLQYYTTDYSSKQADHAAPRHNADHSREPGFELSESMAWRLFLA